MIHLLVRCPECGKKQKYKSYTIKRRSEVFGKKKRCVFCNSNFLIVGKESNRILEEVEFR